MLFPTSLVGSYPQPEWLIDRVKLSKQVPRVRVDDLWLIAADKLEAAQDDATILAIRDQERAGLDIISDGEQRRESYSNRFATALDGIDIATPGTVINRSGKPIAVPRIVGPIRRRQPVELRDLKVLRANTDRAIKATVPGPFTMGRQAQDDYYKDEAAVALDYAAAVNAEIKDLFAAGADVVQINEPGMRQHPGKARKCASKTIIPGVIDLSDMSIETPAIVADRIRRALAHIAAERIVVAPDCGMKYLPRAVAFGKMKAMAEGAAIVRREMTGG